MAADRERAPPGTNAVRADAAPAARGAQRPVAGDGDEPVPPEPDDDRGVAEFRPVAAAW